MPNFIEVNSLSDEGVKVYSGLTEAQLRNRLEPSKGIFIAESPKVIKVALNEGCELVSMLVDKDHIDGPARELLSLCGDIPVYAAPSVVLSELTGYKLTRGCLCAIRRPEPADPWALLKDAKRVALLESVVDATNIGAIFRSAAALNIDAVLLTETCCDPLNRRAVRVSMGTVLQVPWAYIGQEREFLSRLPEYGFKTAAMALSDNSVSIDDRALSAEPRLVIVLGAEGDGLSPATVAACDYTVKIPMSHGVDSLNVAAASAVAFWELRSRT